jgi:hypothetical protein
LCSSTKQSHSSISRCSSNSPNPLPYFLLRDAENHYERGIHDADDDPG